MSKNHDDGDNHHLALLKSHRSIRRFTSDPVPEAHVRLAGYYTGKGAKLT